MNDRVTSLGTRLWSLTLVRGLLMLGLSAAAFAFPSADLPAIFVIFGWFTVADGLISLSIGSVFRHTGWILTAAEGVFSLGLGIMILTLASPGELAIVLVIAGWATAAGLAQLATALRLQRSGLSAWAWVAVSGLVTALLGAFFLVNPRVGTALLGVALGLFAGIVALVLLFGAYRLWRTQPEVRRFLRRRTF